MNAAFKIGRFTFSRVKSSNCCLLGVSATTGMPEYTGSNSRRRKVILFITNELVHFFAEASLKNVAYFIAINDFFNALSSRLLCGP